MQLVILYGPPGVGKLTVAEALVAQTGYKLFHNHLTTDLVTSIFPFGDPRGFALMGALRVQVLTAAARADVPGVIHTTVYWSGGDDEHMRRLIATAEDHGGTAHLVLLTCDEDVLLERVTNASRARFGKLRDPEVAARLLQDRALTTPFPDRPSLVIDTTERDPDNVAAEIAATLPLK